MAGTASDPFFWNDWQADPLLRRCSFEAQGFWMRLLCICAESPRKGYLLVNGEKPTDEDLHLITGAPLGMIKVWTEELLLKGAASITRHGIIYNRKMVRATKKRAASKKGGKIGGLVTLRRQRGIFTTQDPTQGATQGATQHPRRAPLPFPSPIEEESKKERKSISLESPSEGAGDSRSIQTRKSLNGHKEDFDAFYAAFPKHVGKVAAEKAYRAALKKAQDADLAAGDILAGAQRYAMARKGEDQEFTAHPATWLKAGRWMDENQGGAAIDPHVAKFRQLEQANPTPPLKRNPVTGKWSDT